MSEDINKEDPRESAEWQQAENYLTQFHAPPSLSMVMGVTPTLGYTTEELILHLDELLEQMPIYFPAWFQMGLYQLAIGETEKGDNSLDKGFRLMLDIVENEEEFERLLHLRLESLDQLLRYDLAVKYLEQAVKRFPDVPSFYDDLAFYMVHLPGDRKTQAFTYHKHAMEMDPDNDYFISNQGWSCLVLSRVKEAAENFQKAVDFNYENETASANLETAEFMLENKMTYMQYLLRSPDKEDVDELLEDGDYESLEELCAGFNSDRVEAFKMHHLENNALTPLEILKAVQGLTMFMDIQAKYLRGEIFLYDDLQRLHALEKDMMLWYLWEHEWMDDILLKDIKASLKAFYQFMVESGKVTETVCNDFVKEYGRLVEWVTPKLEEYYEIRNDVTLEDDEKTEKLYELLGIEKTSDEDDEDED
ncbi:MAG: hypothetical protein GY765_12575 [bacterium]|nr:hypothetical protein [bacterium]